MRNRTLRLGVVIIAVLAMAFAVSASAGARLDGGPTAVHIAFMSTWDGQADIYAMNTASFAQTNLTHDWTIGLRKDSEPAWSPNGQWIAFQRSFMKSPGSQIYLVKHDGSGLHALMPSIGVAVADVHPNWSPNGDMIVFSSNRTGHFELYVAKASGAGIAQLTFTNPGIDNLEPAWSPDGLTIAFVRSVHGTTMGATSYIYGLSLKSGSTYQMTTPALGRNDGQPAWSPDSLRLAFESDRAGTEDVYLLDRRVKGVTRLTASKQNEYHPTWAPVGNTIALISDRTGATEVYSLQIRPGSVTPPTMLQLTFDKAYKANPAWEHIAPSPGG
jgi:Tol biopolymer transport system component